MIGRLTSFGFLILLASCASKKAFFALPPTATYQKAIERVKEVSTLNIPIEIPLGDVERKINDQLGNLLFEDNSLENNGGDNLILKVTKRQPIQIEAKGGNLFNIKLPVNIYAKAGYKIEKFGVAVAKYVDTNFDIDLNFLSRLNVTPNWTINTSTTPNGYKWISEPKVKIGFFEIPITSIIERIMDKELPNVVKTVDNEVGKINLKPQVETAWKAVQEPFLINETYQAWLKVTPKEIMMSPLSTKGRNVRVSIGMLAVTETFLGNKPSGAVMAQVPALVLKDKMEEKFEVGMITEIPYPQLKKIAMEQTKDKVYEFSEGKRKIKVEDIDIYGQGEDIIVSTLLSGSLNGKVYLKGKPFYDPATSSIKIKDLDYELDTKNKLLKAADWMAHGKFLKLMEPYFSVSVSSQLEEGKKMIQENLAGNKLNKNINLNGKLNELLPQNIYVTPSGVQAVISAKGKLEVLVAGF